MAPTLRRVAILLCSIVVAVATSGSAVAGIGDQTRAERAIGYLRSNQQPNGSIVAFSAIGSTADAVLAIVAAGVAPRVLDDAVDYLRRKAAAGEVDGIGLKAKVVLAIVAAGERPRRFGGRNLVRQIRNTAGPDGHFGGAAVFDQAHAVLALIGAGAELPSNVTQWLLDGQCPDGGWAFDAPYDAENDDDHCVSDPTDFFSSDTNTTSYVVQALEAAADPAWTDDPFAFFDTARDPDHGGWAYSTSFVATDTNSTALVLQAYAAAALDPPAGGLDALRALQYRRCGAWAYSYDGEVKGVPDVGATIGAVPGLLLEPLPITGIVEGAAPPTRDCPEPAP
jgi:hypothetical protein